MHDGAYNLIMVTDSIVCTLIDQCTNIDVCYINTPAIVSSRLGMNGLVWDSGLNTGIGSGLEGV